MKVDSGGLKAHLHGSSSRMLECQYFEKSGSIIQDYVISCNSNITSFIFISSTKGLLSCVSGERACNVRRQRNPKNKFLD